MKLLTRLTVMTSALVLLASCGLRGDLNRPAEPMFGSGEEATSETPGDLTTNAATGEDTMAEEKEEQDDYSDELLGGPDGSY